MVTAMATGAEAIALFSAETGISSATVQRTARALREKGKNQWPKSGPGGGRKANHVEARHLVNLALGLTDPMPSAAPKVVAKLRPLRLREIDRQEDTLLWPESDDVLRRHDFGHVMEWLVDVATRAHMGDPDAAVRVGSWRQAGLQLVVNPGLSVAWMRWKAQDGRELREYFDPSQAELRQVSAAWEQRPPPALYERQIVVPFAVIETAARLWADTLAYRGGKLPFPTPSVAVSPAASGSENAGGVSPPPAPTRSQSGSRQTGGLKAPQKLRRERETQGHESLTAGRSSRNKGTRR
jgi:hypothetical protein